MGKLWFDLLIQRTQRSVAARAPTNIF